MIEQYATTSNLPNAIDSMATTKINKMLDIEDVTSKLTFDALTKRAIRIGDIVFFQAEIYFSTYIGEYTYTLGVDESIRPKTNLAPLNAVMVDGSFTPKAAVSCFITSTALQWRAYSQNGNYLFISGWWKLN